MGARRYRWRAAGARRIAPWALLLLPPLMMAPSAGGSRTPSRPSAARVDFVCDVLPLLQRQGCASAYCHGAATGQGGFKLSLFGSHPRADYAAIARALGGRRLDLVAPDRSLLLQKPLRRIRHGGGRRLEEGSPEHALLRAWIAVGAPFACAPDEHLDELSARRSGDRLVAEARFADAGAVRVVDVSHLALFSSSDDRVARIDPGGNITEVGPGETFLFARYGGRSARVSVTRQFADVAPDAGSASAPLDEAFVTRLDQLGLTAAPQAPPERLLRRLYLDLAGMPPSDQARQRFLARPAATRVQATVDELLASPAFTEVLSRRLATWLELQDDETAPAPRRARVQALRARLASFAASDAPWPQLTRAILDLDGPFLQQHEDPRDRAELVARSLLGVRVGCARCHDHPHDRWRQRDHLAFAACFTDKRPSPRGGMPASTEMAMPSAAAARGALFDGDSGRPIAPRLLPLLEDVPAPTELHSFLHDRRHDLAARALCNRVFAWLLGRGLVEPLDDHRDTNPAVHEAWLDALRAEFHVNGQRLRPLVAAIATSRVYGLDSAGDEQVDDPRTRFFAWRASKPLDPDTRRRAMAAVLGVAESVLPALPASPLRRQLEVLDGETFRHALHAPDNALAALQAIGGTPREQLDALFAACLSRAPTDDERAALLAGFDLHTCASALLASREFEFVR